MGLRGVVARLFPAGSQRWYVTQDLLAVLPRTWGGPTLQSRFYRATLPSCGRDLQLSGGVHLYRPERIRIGNRVTLARGVHITGHAEVTIGDDVAIGPYTVINSGDHRFDDPTRPISAQGHRTGPVVIDGNVWIGAHCVVLRGVRIGAGSVVGAMSVVRADVPPGTLAAGVPARPRRATTGGRPSGQDGVEAR